MKFKQIATIFIPLLMLLVCIGIAALLGYLVFFAIEGRLDLDKIISKTALVLLLLCTFPARRMLKFSWAELGFKPRAVFIREIGLGILIGLAILLPVLISLYIMDILVVDQTRDWSLFYISKSLLVAIFLSFLVSFAEEPLFRGVLLTAYAKKFGIAAGILLSSFYYAILHFTKTDKELALDEASFSGTFDLVSDALMNVINPANLTAMISLLMVGIFLGILRQKMQLGMGICIGCHTGWVVLLKMTRKFFNNDWHHDLSWLVSHYDGVIGPLVTAWLALANIVLIAYIINKSGRFSKNSITQ
jgi:membrane protease YdiL (CAAX protease family)